MIFGLIMWVLLGALAGFIAGKIMETQEQGFVVNAILGIIGSVVAGLIGKLIGIGSHGLLGSLIFAIIGACLVIFIGRKMKEKS